MTPRPLVQRSNLLRIRSSTGESGSTQGGSNDIPLIVGITIVIALLCIAVGAFIILRRLRQRNYAPKYIPTQFLKRKWRDWTPTSSYGQVPNDPAGQQNRSNYAGNTSYGGAAEMETQVDRQTSVRSVMTLPSYTPAPKPTEQVIGREGERAGMDVVVEFPETVEEEEDRREEQMESLYQIRQARRREIAEREERRRQRREARERGDWERLQELRRESRARAESQTSASNGSSTNLSAATLMAEHQSRGRERRISAVSYAEVGRVRHDGTRVRSNSPDSDSQPLLNAAAGMGGHHVRNNLSLDGFVGTHHRGESSTSIISQGSSIISDTTPRGSTSSVREADVADSGIPPPPEYDHLDWGDAPPYQSPIHDRGEAPQLPVLTVVPSIEVEIATPANSSPVSTPLPSPREPNSQR